MVKLWEKYDDLLLPEARAKEEYYKCFDGFAEGWGFVFHRRSRRPPENILNAMLSFGRGRIFFHKLEMKNS